jgi:hypothetical protein
MHGGSSAPRQEADKHPTVRFSVGVDSWLGRMPAITEVLVLLLDVARPSPEAPQSGAGAT